MFCRSGIVEVIVGVVSGGGGARCTAILHEVFKCSSDTHNHSIVMEGWGMDRLTLFLFLLILTCIRGRANNGAANTGWGVICSRCSGPYSPAGLQARGLLNNSRSERVVWCSCGAIWGQEDELLLLLMLLLLWNCISGGLWQLNDSRVARV